MYPIPLSTGGNRDNGVLERVRERGAVRFAVQFLDVMGVGLGQEWKRVLNW